MKVKIAQIQAHVYEEKSKNLEELERNLKRIKDENIDLVTLGEMFNCPYQTPCFPVYAEMEQGETWQRLSALAKKYKIYLSAGSVPEKDKEGHVYNTAYVFERQGNQIAKHRKVHLFDIAVKDGQCYQESATLTAGDQITVFDTEFGKMGICICFDCRFPEIVRLMTLRGARMILVPFFVLFILTGWGGDANRYICLAIFVVASITDWFDGHLARKNNLVTNFGKFMDPLADKLLVCSALICMIELDRLPAWFVIIIIAREFIISGFRLIAAENGVVIAANYWGKFKTASQMVMIILLILNFGGAFEILTQIFVWASLALTVISLITYIVQNKNVISMQE